MDFEYIKNNYSTIISEEQSIESSELYSLIFILHELKVYDKLYVLSKKFILVYLEEVRDSSYGYDVINVDKLEEILSLFEGKKKMLMTEYYIRRLKDSDETLGLAKLISIRNHMILNSLKSDLSLRNLSDFVFKLLLGNVTSLLFIFLLSIILLFLIFLPAPIECMVMFSIDFEDYSDINSLNLFYNVISVLFGVENDFVIKPTNSFGAPLIFIGRAFYIFVIAGSFGQYLLDKFQKLKEDI